MYQKVQSEPSSKKETILMASGLLVVVSVIFYMWYKIHTVQIELSAKNKTAKPISQTVLVQSEPKVESIKTLPVETPSEPMLAKPEIIIVQPPTALDGSDPLVLKAIEDLAPDMLGWITTKQQIRKWVLAVDLIADGQVPKQNRALSFPIRPFDVGVLGLGDSNKYYMTLGHLLRTNQLLTVIIAIDPERLATYYQMWLPILDKAYQEQGKRDAFDKRFKLAIARILAVKPLDKKPMLIKKGGVLYAYADPALESASDVEKMMWRLGPANSAKLQEFLQKLLDAVLSHEHTNAKK